jgi:hypothetical protein
MSIALIGAIAHGSYNFLSATLSGITQTAEKIGDFVQNHKKLIFVGILLSLAGTSYAKYYGEQIPFGHQNDLKTCLENSQLKQIPWKIGPDRILGIRPFTKEDVPDCLAYIFGKSLYTSAGYSRMIREVLEKWVDLSAEKPGEIALRQKLRDDLSNAIAGCRLEDVETWATMFQRKDVLPHNKTDL